MASEQKNCFVIAPIGEDGSEVRQRSDWVLESIIRPAVEPLGYRPIRGDQISEPGDVMRQVVERVVNDPLVVADLTGSNPNVLYELALRHATGKRPILLIQRGEKPPYDIYGERRIEPESVLLEDSNRRVVFGLPGWLAAPRNYASA